VGLVTVAAGPPVGTSTRRPRAPSSRRQPHCLIRAVPLLRVEGAAAAGGQRDALLLRIEGAAAVRICLLRIELLPSAAGVHAPPWPSPPSSRSTELGCATPPRDPPPPCLPRSSARWWSRPSRASPPRAPPPAAGARLHHGLRRRRERADRVGDGAVGLQRREFILGMHNRGEATANCSSHCSIRWSMHSRASFCIRGMQQRLQKPLETVLYHPILLIHTTLPPYIIDEFSIVYN
jgi:hypothetical protein